MAKEPKAKKTTRKKTTRKKTAGKKTSQDARAGKRNLVVVESPAKAKTIKKFVGSGFTIKASMGHVRDIPTRSRGQKAFGIDFDNGYQPDYEPIKGREKVLKELAAAAQKADCVYLAPDPDREGEAIAWHIKEALHLPDDKVRRVTFNAITRSAVREAMEQPRSIDMNLVNAQQGRRVLDRIVGFSLSPFLWKKVAKGLSAGRVQSVAVRMVVEREKEIRAFDSEEFWRITALLSPAREEEAQRRFQAGLVEWRGEKFELGNPSAGSGKSAQEIVAALRKETFSVAEVSEREVKGRPSPSFITSTLQQAASSLLHFGTRKTMRVAQQLYEGVELEGGATGLITYMRTDSTRIAPEALAAARDYIKDNFAPAYLPEKAQVYSSRKGAQDAHEAIRPTSPDLAPEAIKRHLTQDQYRLYDLIWRRFMASQMNPAIYKTTTARISAGEGVFLAKGRQVIFDGHTVLGLGQARRKKKKKDDADNGDAAADKSITEDQVLPRIETGDHLGLHELEPSQHFTQPPPRYSEASLVRALEKEGIGRPSTYAPIVQTIQERGYVRQEKRRFHATTLGMAVTDLLVDHFGVIMDLKFTAGMENDLDNVEEGQRQWSDLMDAFYKPFHERLQRAMEEAAPLRGQPAPHDEKCPLCDSSMVMRYSAQGAFLGCGRYPECKGTIHLPGEGEAGGAGEGEPEVLCPACGAGMVRKRSRFGEFMACSNYPECKTTKPIGRDGKVVELPRIEGVVCEECGKPMQVKMSRRGPFLGCSGYPECKNTKPISRDGKVVELPKIEGINCDKCGEPMRVKMSRRGPFLSCSAYPKCRNAKPLPKKTEPAGKGDAKT